MANNCHCTLKVTGKQDQLNNFAEKAQGPSPEQTLSLQSLRPSPENLSNAERRDWRQSNWGPTGEAYRVPKDTEPKGVLTYWFTTPWAPPNESFIAHIAAAFHELSFYLDFEEPMLAYEGRISAQNGEVKISETHSFDFYERYTTDPPPAKAR